MDREGLTPLKIISRWKEYVEIIVKAIRESIPDAMICLTGGAVENRLTVSSDIDILVVLNHKPSFEEAAEIRSKIFAEAYKRGLPLYAPIELHIIGSNDLRRYRKVKCF
jgi:predicted nucleotidyltransferase